MGTVLGFLNKDFQLPAGAMPGSNFLNATASSNAENFYRVAQQALDKAQRDLVDLVKKKNEIQDSITTWDSSYGIVAQQIKNGDAAAVIRLLQNEKYGSGSSTTWKNVGDLYDKIDMAGLSNRDLWNLVFNGGPSSDPVLHNVQWNLLHHFMNNTYDPYVKSLQTALDGVNTRIAEKTTQINTLTKRRDEARLAAEAASKQQIQENMSTPEYLAAKAQADKILADAANKKRMTTTILALGALGILVFGAAIIFRNRG